jgi:cell division septum initiation protein DivIVA
MNIREIAKPITAKALNESLAKRFGTTINVDKFTLEQLQDARNKLRTQISQYETNESFDVTRTESYQKSKLFLNVLNAAISEREDITEKMDPVGKEDDDVNNDGKKDSSDEYLKKRRAAIAKSKTKESIVREGAEDSAELVMAAKDMVDRVTSWMEDTAEMQTESMLELADAIRDEMGSEQADSFVNTVKPALEALYATMESTRTALTGGVGIVTGEGGSMDATMGADNEMEPTVDGEEELAVEPGAEGELDAEMPAEDDFGAAEPATGGEEEAGRAKRESVDRSRKLGQILSKKK